MFIIYGLILGIITGYALKGKLRYVLDTPFRCNYLVFTAIGIQLVIFSGFKIVSAIPNIAIVLLHIASYILALLYILANLKSPGIAVIGVGTILNSLVILLNGGYMPSASLNLEAYNNVKRLTEGTYLPWLGDIFHLPKWLPLTNSFSIGDICIFVGVYLYLVINMRGPKQSV